MNTFLKKIIFTSLIAASFLSCKKAKSPDATSTSNKANLKKEILNDIADHVIYATYADMDVKANSLYNAVIALNNNTNTTNLQLAQQAWKDLRASWEQSEGFLFGPVSIDNIDPRIDTWPIDYSRLDSVLASSAVLNSTYVNNLEDALKGFHPLEYLLFGVNGNKMVSDFTTREKEYLIALTDNLQCLCQAAKNSWDINTMANYSNEFYTAGSGSSIYQTQRSAYEEIIDAMIGICDEVANGKIAEPYINQNASLEESPFANNSINDFTNNMKSVQNMYLGKYTNDAKGLEDLIKSSNLSMDGTIKIKIANALTALGNVTVPFGQAISTQPTQVQNCITSINDLRNYLDATVKPYLQTLTN